MVSIIRPTVVGSIDAKAEFARKASNTKSSLHSRTSLTISPASGIAAILLASIEANTGIICASLLCLKPLISCIWPALLNDSRPPRNNLRLPSSGNHQTTFLNQKTLTLSTTTFESSTDIGTVESRLQFPILVLPEHLDLPLAITRTPRNVQQLGQGTLDNGSWMLNSCDSSFKSIAFPQRSHISRKGSMVKSWPKNKVSYLDSSRESAGLLTG